MPRNHCAPYSGITVRHQPDFALENFNRKERVPVTEYTIEHIMPQDEKLSKVWRDVLGPEWERIHKTLLHTLGNLTLTGYNSEYSNRPFDEKRDMKGGFRNSPLKLNEGLADVKVWDESAILSRAEKLATIALNVWKKPELSDDILATYNEKQEQHTGYTIEDFPYLSQGTKTRELFDAFRVEVLALDKVVVEEFLKLYIAYKAETNFVDVVPQASRLRLSINMPFSEVFDPKNLCKDVTNLGRWGNGDVEIGLNSKKDLPYVMGLVRQSFERQMGNGEDE